MLNKLKEYDSISFCFDGLLVDDMDGDISSYKDDMRALLIDLLKLKKYVFILTKRYNHPDYDDIRDNKFKDEYKIALDFIKEYSLEKNIIIFTRRNLFNKYLNNSSTHCHLEISEYEKLMINIKKPDTEVILITKNWKEL